MGEAAMMRVLVCVYGLRSRALHEAVPFPPPRANRRIHSMRTAGGASPIAEKSFYVWSYAKRGFCETDNTPMLLNTFEYIVRHTLLECWRQLCDRSPTNTGDAS